MNTVKQHNYLTQVGNKDISKSWKKFTKYGSNSVTNQQSDLPQMVYGSISKSSLKLTTGKDEKELSQFNALYPFWVAVRRTILRELEEALRKLEKLEGVSEISSSINKSVGITGAVTAISGAILLPFTFGLSSAGVVSGAIVGLSSVTAMTASKVAERRSVLQVLNKCCYLIDQDAKWTHRLLRDLDSVTEKVLESSTEKVLESSTEKVLESSTEKVAQDFQNSSRLPCKGNFPDLLSYLRSLIIPTPKNPYAQDNVFTYEGYPVLIQSETSKERKEATKKRSSVKDTAYDPTGDCSTLTCLTDMFHCQLLKCCSIDKQKMEAEKEEFLKMMSIKLDAIALEAIALHGEPNTHPAVDSGSCSSKIPDNGKLDSEEQSIKFGKFEQMFFEAVERYKKSKNINYVGKLRKKRSKPKSISSLRYVLKELTNYYYEQFSMFAECHKFLAQHYENYCCKHECVQLFYYPDKLKHF